MTTARPPTTAREKATTASIQEPRPLSDRRHHPVLSLANVPGGIRLHRGPIGGGVVGVIRFLPGLGARIAQDPDERDVLIDRPGADALVPLAPPEWRDKPRPLIQPGRHLSWLDRVDPKLMLQRLLAAFEDDDRNFSARQLLLTFDIRHEGRKPLAFIGPGCSRPHLDLVGTSFNSGDRARLEIDVPRGMFRCAVARSDHDKAVAILAEAEYHGPFLARLRASRGQQQHRAARHLAAELPTIGPELIDQLSVEGFDVGGNLGRWSPWRRLLLTHALYRMFIWISSYHSCRNPR